MVKHVHSWSGGDPAHRGPDVSRPQADILENLLHSIAKMLAVQAARECWRAAGSDVTAPEANGDAPQD